MEAHVTKRPRKSASASRAPRKSLHLKKETLKDLQPGKEAGTAARGGVIRNTTLDNKCTYRYSYCT